MSNADRYIQTLDNLYALPVGSPIQTYCGIVRALTPDRVIISCASARPWARRPNNIWPCSTLMDFDGFGVIIDHGPDGFTTELTPLSADDADRYVDAVELEAFVEDAIADALRVRAR